MPTDTPPPAFPLRDLLGFELEMGDGNATATLDEPHYTGTFTVAAGQFPQVGGEASESAWTWSDSYLVKDDVVTRDPVITRAAAPAKS